MSSERQRTTSRAGWKWRAIGIALVLGAAAAALAAERLGIAKDGIHDPTSPAIGVLQEPAEALSSLPPDTAGNGVRWVRALEEGKIKPRASIDPNYTVNLRTTEVLLMKTADMHLVRFPHREHTAWLDCSNCHDALFSRTAGATKIGMFLVLAGEKCGLCHGAVAFPLTECNRCHSVARGSPEAAAFGKSLVREAGPP
jgi:c(7)-type cytochrome triheme protein